MGIGTFGRAWGRDQDSASSSADRSRPGQEGGRLTAIIDRGSQFDGHVRSAGTLRIDGELRGEIGGAECVVVGETAAVEAKIRAKSIIISGAVVGDVVGSRQVILRSTGRLHGNVETPSLVVEQGAVFNGASKMFRPEAVARAEEPRREAVEAKTERPPTPARNRPAQDPGRAPVASM